MIKVYNKFYYYLSVIMREKDLRIVNGEIKRLAE
jgi:hypothetical protein